jgi:antitoxin component of MazEF toxin-antitoxin module
MAIIRKVSRSGSSISITVPFWMLEQIGCKVGDMIAMVCYPEQMITIEKMKPAHQAELEARK